MVHHIYCDESRQTKDRYMVLSAIIISQHDLEEFNATMAKYRKQEKINGELKWQKVSKAYKEKYKLFINYFFALNSNHTIHFKAIIVDNHQFNNNKFNKGNKEDGFYKMFYQLLLHKFLRPYYDAADSTKFVIVLDHRYSSYKLQDLKDILNNGMHKKMENIAYGEFPVVSIEARDSKQSEVIQVNDIILGAIGYHKNGNHLLAGSSKWKTEIAEHIAKMAGLEDLTKDTKWGQRRFEIWNIKLQR